KGTGLGLAMVHGVVKQSGGEILVYSTPGKGTTFKVYLPRVASTEAPRVASSSSARRSAPGTETVLLVEDEEQVRLVAARVLTRAGYTVIGAASPAEALRLCAEGPVAFDLVLSDVIMPGIDGPALAERLKVGRPGMKILFMSGYTGGALVHHGVLDEGIAYLQKPFTPDVLLAKVKETLERP
ncbi:MAG: response regulator, partial [Archangium sp.]|nr:response regulator [Archangium sp.]